MELKVWVEGIQRVVCGVTDTTTCEDVVYALAHATGKTGRFTLIEKWRNSERLLAPSEFPRKILLKWGEYSTDVQFILQRSALEQKIEEKRHAKAINSHGSSSSCSGSPMTSSSIQSCSPKQEVSNNLGNRDIKKSLTFSGAHVIKSMVSKEQNESLGEVGSYGKQNEFHKSSTYDNAYPVKPNDRISYHSRPLAPPPYEVVKGNPPMPNSCHHNIGNPTLKYNNALKTNEVNSNPVRVAPPYSRASQFSKVRMAQMPMNNFTHSLPPYRNPPAPPVPSHPALLKLVNHSDSEGNMGKKHAIVNSGEKVSCFRKNASSCVHKLNMVNSTSNNFITHKPHIISTSNHNTKLECNSPCSLRNTENSLLSNVKVSPVVYSKSLPESFHPEISGKSVINEVSLASIHKLDQTDHSNSSHVENYESTTKLNGYQDNSNMISGDINDNVFTSHSVITNKKQIGKDSYQINELFDQLVRQNGSCFDQNNSLDNHVEQVVVDSFYKSLVKLINMQRETLNSQQVDLTKSEAEIAYLDGRCKESESRLNYLQADIKQLEKIEQIDINSESVEKLEKELENAQNSKSSMIILLSEIREKYSSCLHTIEQLQSKSSSLENKLIEELEQQKKCMESENEEEELAILREVEKLQNAVLQANEQVKNSEEVSNLLCHEITQLEKMINAKRNEIEHLRQSMKEANLEALTMTPPDDLKQSQEGIWKSGTSRVMKGSPRQLETAVPTSKNPHGVWV